MTTLTLIKPKSLVSAAQLVAPVFDGPLTITDALISSRGSNVFEGNWENTSYTADNGAAVYVQTTQPVIFENSRLKAQKDCISSVLSGTNITVRNCLGLARNTTYANQAAGRFVSVYQPASLIVEGNTTVGGSGVYSDGSPAVGGTVLYRVRYNRSINVDGRLSDGAGGYVFEVANVAGAYFQARQMVQINKGTFPNGGEIAWNECLNDPFISRREDAINITSCVGTETAPMWVHDNCVRGGVPARPYNNTFSGCGIVTEGATTRYLDIDDNYFIGHANIGIGLAEGDYINVRRNRIVSAGNVWGVKQFMRNSSGCYGMYADSDHIVITDNGLSMLNDAGGQTTWYRPNPGAVGNIYTGNYTFGAPTNEATETAEWEAWRAKVAAAGVTIGSTLAA